MGGYRWCSFCTHAFSDADLSEDEFGLPSCPYCGAPGMYLRVWHSVRSLFPEIPDRPQAGHRYRLRERPPSGPPEDPLPTGGPEATVAS